MDVAIIQLGEPWQTLVSTSLIKGIKRVFGSCNLHWTTTQEGYPLLQHNPSIARVSSDIRDHVGPYDFIINLTPNLDVCKHLSGVRTNARFGYIYDENANGIKFANQDARDWNDLLCGNDLIESGKTVLQRMFRVAGMTWRGEGYDLAYYPRNKVKKGKVGIAIADGDLRVFVKRNLELSFNDLWHIPMRKNLLKRIDEINICKNIVTDDLFTLHAGISLRKNVQFLDRKNLKINFEFFGRGQHHRIGEYGG